MKLSLRLPLIASLAAFGLGIALAACAPQPAAVQQTEPAQAASPAAPQTVSAPLDDPSIGPADAPIVIQEYGDYSCPSCVIWQEQGVMKKLLEKYGDKIRFVRHDYAVLSPQSRPAALAARCAGDQGKYWEYHDLVYEKYPALEVSDLKQYAADLTLDTATFNECLDSEKHFKEVAAGLKDGIDHGVFATPEFLVNDKHIAGGQSFDYFVNLIDPMLAGGRS